MVTVFGDEEPATPEQATPIRFDTSYEQPETLSLDQYIDAAVERAIRKLDAPVATMIRSFNATPDRHENMIIATPQRLNDTVMVTPHQHDNTVVATPNRHVATVVATPEKINTDLDILTILNEEKKIENTPDTQIEKIVTQHLKSLMQIEDAHADRSPKNYENVQNDEKMGQTVHINRLKPAFVLGVPDETFIDPHDSPSNPRDVATPEPRDTTMTPETNKEDWYESYGWSTPAAVAPAPVPTTSSKEHTPRTPREEASTQHSTPSELDRDLDADHNFDRSTERETERSEIPHGIDDPQTSRADRHETPLCHTDHHDESTDRNADRNATRNADRNATRNADRNADRHKVRCTEEVNEDGEPIESSDEEFEEAKEDPPAKRLSPSVAPTLSSKSYSPEHPDCGIPLPSSSPPPRAPSRTGIFADSDWDEELNGQTPPEPLPTPVREPQILLQAGSPPPPRPGLKSIELRSRSVRPQLQRAQEDDEISRVSSGSQLIIQSLREELARTREELRQRQQPANENAGQSSAMPTTHLQPGPSGLSQEEVREGESYQA
ncbi:hypothetical protein GE061_020319 [Apolygus lucorum]|uniref:Uncharacterized protein n=1 Tax=Apolygus lucorum TaxID=248454 RepID=A0A8S9WPG8_APOLU|nr:hypothetical protein GE061_020319 [Apolygus lucorum]